MVWYPWLALLPSIPFIHQTKALRVKGNGSKQSNAISWNDPVRSLDLWRACQSSIIYLLVPMLKNEKPIFDALGSWELIEVEV
jgi:hypothetical protein